MTHDHSSDESHGDPFRDWDAPYLLGSLSAADRRAYEQHLRLCDGCREGLTEFVPLPGLLSHLPQDDALRLIEQPEPGAQEVAPSDLLTRLAAAADAVRRRTRLTIAGLVLAAAGVSAAAAIAIPLAVGPSLSPVETVGSTVALAAAPGVPVEASVKFVPQQWGTRIDMDCSWSDTAQQIAGSTGYVLYVTDTSGSTESVGSWTSAPGTTMEPSLATGLPLSRIASVEVRLQDSGLVVLTGRP
ncbi:anti-sigma factor family protein [Rathayibacter tanaceti]|uniref:Anti-sigma factor n=2 Tax=Rathayibacter tanaceti TaxID=1671680 RepID=A0A166HCN9_9MICO|nr:zf-HC2 domain-containing protein [Rathayibacter tanaceti]KZX20362.1 Anti-sigma-L factor RslA [Rathayibacter tanaceti]QHC56102.1 anti-sigma factor [Rathayibacter tanaceti]TCO36938.1 putative zinc finger protein [Rathayibacter tanaceti]